jgi:hypothetical protein
VNSAAETATREARELAARAEGAREAALAELKLAHEDARRARDEVERVRAELEKQIARERERAEVRVEEVRKNVVASQLALERELQGSRELVQQARVDAQRVAEELARQREASARELSDERARAETRMGEVRSGLQAQLSSAQQLAAERMQARDQLAQQLEAERSTKTATPSAPQKKKH